VWCTVESAWQKREKPGATDALHLTKKQMDARESTEAYVAGGAATTVTSQKTAKKTNWRLLLSGKS